MGARVALGVHSSSSVGLNKAQYASSNESGDEVLMFLGRYRSTSVFRPCSMLID